MAPGSARFYQCRTGSELETIEPIGSFREHAKVYPVGIPVRVLCYCGPQECLMSADDPSCRAVPTDMIADPSLMFEKEHSSKPTTSVLRGKKAAGLRISLCIGKRHSVRPCSVSTLRAQKCFFP